MADRPADQQRQKPDPGRSRACPLSAGGPGFSQRQIVVGYYVFCALFGAIALVTASRLYKLIALVVMVSVTFVALRF